MDGAEKMTFDEYLEKTRQGLIDSTWNYTDEQAEKYMVMGMHYIREAFKRDEPVDDVVAEVGFGCG